MAAPCAIAVATDQGRAQCALLAKIGEQLAKDGDHFAPPGLGAMVRAARRVSMSADGGLPGARPRGAAGAARRLPISKRSARPAPRALSGDWRGGCCRRSESDPPGRRET